MMTGLHTVKSVMCKQCRVVIGWTYVFAYEESEKYKEGKFIVERDYMAKKTDLFEQDQEEDEAMEDDWEEEID